MDNFGDKYKRKNPFTMPEGYLENLTDRVMGNVEEQVRPPKSRFLQMAKPYMGLVAIFGLAMLVVQVLLPLVIDKNRMLLKDGDKIVQVQETPATEEVVFDSQFEPTNDEIIEYLASEVNTYDLMYADVY